MPSKTSSTANKPERFALIIGAMKCGTTSLFDILGQHPQICPCRHKEPDFFIQNRSAGETEQYLSLWPWKKSQHHVALESSVAYTKYPLFTDTPRRIYESGLGEFKFIYMLRHPLKRIESQIRHGLYAGWGKSLDESLDESAIHFSSYASQIDQFLQFFPRENLLVLTLEEFKNQPAATLERICIFLGIDDSFNFHDTSTPRNSGDFFTSTANLAWLTQNPIAQFAARHLLSSNAKQTIRRLLSRPGRKPASLPGRWQLNEMEKKQILSRLNNDLIRLQNEFDIDVKALWGLHPDHSS